MTTGDGLRVMTGEPTYAELQARAAELERLFESLTPGGSEYSGDPERCAKFVRDCMANTIKQKMRAAELERVLRMYPEFDEDGYCPVCCKIGKHSDTCLRQKVLTPPPPPPSVPERVE